jgi:hypothetical protein
MPMEASRADDVSARMKSKQCCLAGASGVHDLLLSKLMFVSASQLCFSAEKLRR